MKTVWRFEKTIVDGEEYKINGINIWDFKWEVTGEKIKIKDPLYGQSYTFNVFKIQNDNIEILFAAGEFSNCIWGIYLKEDTILDIPFNEIKSIKEKKSGKMFLLNWLKNLFS